MLILRELKRWKRNYGKIKEFFKYHSGSLLVIAPLTNMVLILISARISNYIHYKMCYEIIYPFPNLKGATAEVWG